jgi:hypothetical protein
MQCLALSKWTLAEKRNEDIIRLFEVLCTRTRNLLNRATDIRHGVANQESLKSKRYRLPAALVKAAERFFQFLYTAPQVLQLLRTIPKQPRSKKYVDESLALADHFGYGAEIALSHAQYDFLLMAHSGINDRPAIVFHSSISPQSVVVTCMGNLIDQKLSHDMKIVECYRTILSKLVCTLLIAFQS